jgi:tetratricopeptide (TPR) repeat protein
MKEGTRSAGQMETRRLAAIMFTDIVGFSRQMGTVLNSVGRSADTLRMIEQAMRLNPRYPPAYLFQLGLTYHLTGRYAEAISTMKEVLRQHPNWIFAHANLTAS